MDLYNLLAEQRFDIEYVFDDARKHGLDVPKAPSQSNKAQVILDQINAIKDIKKRFELIKIKNKCKEFLIIHKAANLLEKRNRDARA